ncbi:MAG: hypothetical protein QHH04_04105 [Methanolinea sp.]|nr:hypothetical protein [Methanolinea sp.]
MNTGPSPRSIVAIAILLLVCTGLVSAYELSIYAPATIQKGKPLVVNGTSNIPAGISVDIVLSRSEYTTEEVARKTVTLQSNKEFSVVFDTKDLQKGQYKVEVPSIQGYAFLGGSVTLRIVQVVDRSDEVIIKSMRTQEMDGTLEIAGITPKNPNSGVQVEVVGPGDEVVFGPQYISTSSDGSFSLNVPITKAGSYEVSITDSKGFIGTYPFTVNERVETVVTPATKPANLAAITATAQASAEKPAYFVITGPKGKVNVSTSTGIDWVIEYADQRGTVQKVNSRGQVEPEEIAVDVSGDALFLKVYPYRLSDKGDVTVFVEGAERIGVATEFPPVFAPTATPTTKSPLPLVLAVIAFVLMALGKRYR